MAKAVRSELNHPHPKINFSKSQDLARQEFKDEANVNNLLKRYSQTGAFYDPLTIAKANRKPLFGDFTKFNDFQACQNAIIEAHAAFDSLPSDVRKKFNYDPAALIEWLGDDKNRDEAIKLGLIDPLPPAAPASSQKAAAAAPASSQKAAAAATPVSGPDGQGAA